MHFTCEKHPNLVVRFGVNGRVSFSGGEADVEDVEMARRLADFAGRHPEYGVESHDEIPEPEPEPEDPYADLDDEQLLDAFVTIFGDDAEVPDDREAAIEALRDAEQS